MGSQFPLVFLTDKKGKDRRMTRTIVSQKGQPWPVEKHARYGQILQQFLSDLFEICEDVLPHYDKKELKAVLQAQEKVNRLRCLLDARACAETSGASLDESPYYWPPKTPANTTEA